jgi:NTE family protein
MDRINRKIEGTENISVTKEKSNTMHNALVLQGGGALAAYEVGVYGALYFWIKKDLKEDQQDRNIFDIIAGTSGGAINGAIIVSHVLKRRKQKSSIADSWKGSLRKLFDFWDHISSSPDISKWGPYSFFPEVIVDRSSVMPFLQLPYRWEWPLSERTWTSRWDSAHSKDNSIATGEAARRYYSAKEYLYSGAPNVFTRLPPAYDNRFFDESFMPTNIWYQYSNELLLESIKQHASFPIATTFESSHQEDKQQPRLLMVSVDVQTGSILTFDSYAKEGKVNIRKSEYKDYAKKEGGGADEEAGDEVSAHKGGKIAITYDDGIMAEHVMASSSVPVHYDYAQVPIDYSDWNKGSRKFWDGGVLSNTPLRELIQAHENYWNQVKSGRIHEIPDLKVFIANIWPNESEDIPTDHDAVIDRRNNLTYQDKTIHEEKVAYLIRDYIDLANELIKRARISSDELKTILMKEGASRHRDGKRRKYGDLLEKKVRIIEVTRIQRKPDSNDISYKWCDYSSDTISKLFQQGFKETVEQLLQKITNGQKSTRIQQTALDGFISEIDNERTDPTLAEEERLTDKQARLMQRTISHLIKP